MKSCSVYGLAYSTWPGCWLCPAALCQRLCLLIARPSWVRVGLDLLLHHLEGIWEPQVWGSSNHSRTHVRCTSAVSTHLGVECLAHRVRVQLPL